MIGSSLKALKWKRLPNSIRGFIIAYLACVGFGAANAYGQFEFLRVRLLETFATSELPDDSWVYGMILVRAAFALAILVWVILRHSVVGRLIVAVQFMGWAYGTPASIQMIADGNFKPVPFLLAGFCSAIAVTCLVLKPSRDWFARKGRTLADDLESFS